MAAMPARLLPAPDTRPMIAVTAHRYDLGTETTVERTINVPATLVAASAIDIVVGWMRSMTGGLRGTPLLVVATEPPADTGPWTVSFRTPGVAWRVSLIRYDQPVDGGARRVHNLDREPSNLSDE